MGGLFLAGSVTSSGHRLPKYFVCRSTLPKYFAEARRERDAGGTAAEPPSSPRLRGRYTTELPNCTIAVGEYNR